MRWLNAYLLSGSSGRLFLLLSTLLVIAGVASGATTTTGEEPSTAYSTVELSTADLSTGDTTQSLETTQPNVTTLGPTEETTKPDETTLVPTAETTPSGETTLIPTAETTQPDEPTLGTTGETTQSDETTLDPTAETTLSGETTLVPTAETTQPDVTTLIPTGETTQPDEPTLDTTGETTQSGETTLDAAEETTQSAETTQLTESNTPTETTQIIETTTYLGTSEPTGPSTDSQTFSGLTDQTGPTKGATSEDSGASTESVTTEMPACDAGRFGPPACEFFCMCRDSTEICDSRSGVCKTGCPSGRGGPGCNLITAGGDDSVVVVLALLLVIALIFAIVLFGILLRKKRRNTTYGGSDSGAENAGFDMEPKVGGIERIRETDIQVITNPLGEGRFGDILPGKIQRGKRRIDVAFKTLKEDATDADRNALMAQLEIYNKLDLHPNVIQFYGLCAVGDQFFAAFEFAVNGNLRNFLRRNGMPESEATYSLLTLSRTMLINFCAEIAQGMHYLASQKIVHKELMARHIMVTKDFSCKVSGLNPTLRNEKNKPVRWMAPESLQEGLFTHASDVWSFGIVMWEVMSLGGQPYPEVSTKELPTMVDSGYRMQPPENCDHEVYDLMKKCWDSEPEIRPPFVELMSKLKFIMEEVSDEISLRVDEDDDLDEVLDD